MSRRALEFGPAMLARLRGDVDEVEEACEACEDGLGRQEWVTQQGDLEDHWKIAVSASRPWKCTGIAYKRVGARGVVPKTAGGDLPAKGSAPSSVRASKHTADGGELMMRL